MQTHNIMALVDEMALRGATSLRTECPKCHKMHFSVSLEEGVLPLVKYHCFSASCGLSGAFYVGYREFTKTGKPKPARNWAKDSITMTTEGIKFLRRNYPHTFESEQDIPKWWKWHEKEKAIIIPLSGVFDGTNLNSDGPTVCGRQATYLCTDHLGYAFKYTDRNRKPKQYVEKSSTGTSVQILYESMTYLRNCRARELETVVLVEDAISCHQLDLLGYPAVALMGTNISLQYLEYLTKHRKVQRCLLMLDKDTWESQKSLTLKYVSEWNWMFPEGIAPMLVPSDPKDTSKEELRQLIRSVI